MPNKPCKYGLKYFNACDVATAYCHNSIFYVGKSDDVAEKQKSVATEIVMKLSEPYFGSYRCVTMDNYFSSIPLAKKLFENDLTMIGTIRSNKVISLFKYFNYDIFYKLFKI